MEERFFIYLTAAGDVRWHAGAGQPINAGSLDEALQEAGDRELVIIVPGETVLLTRVNIPPVRQAGKRLQAARYALEEQTASHIEDLHIALGPRLADGSNVAALVDHELMQTWLDRIGESKAQVQAIIPDTLSIPRPVEDNWLVVLVGGRALVRTGEHSGFACEQALLESMLIAAGSSGQQLTVHADEDAQTGELLAELEARGFELERNQIPGDPARSGLPFAAAYHKPALNLLQNEFAPTNVMDEWWRPFRATAALFAGWVLLSLAVQGLEYLQLNHQNETLNAQAEERFREAFPQVQNINNIRVQAEQEIRKLRGSNDAAGLFALLQASAAVAGNTAIEWQSLQYRDGALLLSLRGENVQALEQLRSGFARQPDANLEVESADAGADGVQIRARVTGSST